MNVADPQAGAELHALEMTPIGYTPSRVPFVLRLVLATVVLTAIGQIWRPMPWYFWAPFMALPAFGVAVLSSTAGFVDERVVWRPSAHRILRRYQASTASIDLVATRRRGAWTVVARCRAFTPGANSTAVRYWPAWARDVAPLGQATDALTRGDDAIVIVAGLVDFSTFAANSIARLALELSLAARGVLVPTDAGDREAGLHDSEPGSQGRAEALIAIADEALRYQKPAGDKAKAILIAATHLERWRSLSGWTRFEPLPTARPAFCTKVASATLEEASLQPVMFYSTGFGGTVARTFVGVHPPEGSGESGVLLAVTACTTLAGRWTSIVAHLAGDFRPVYAAPTSPSGLDRKVDEIVAGWGLAGVYAAAGTAQGGVAVVLQGVEYTSDVGKVVAALCLELARVSKPAVVAIHGVGYRDVAAPIPVEPIESEDYKAFVADVAEGLAPRASPRTAFRAVWRKRQLRRGADVESRST